jgi:hypothetical protein
MLGISGNLEAWRSNNLGLLLEGQTIPSDMKVPYLVFSAAIPTKAGIAAEKGISMPDGCSILILKSFQKTKEEAIKKAPTKFVGAFSLI